MKTTSSPLPRPASQTFGLFALIGVKRTILPLKGVECDFTVVSGMVEVAMTQVFRQDNEKPLDCEYLFPLPADASVYHCEADINGRTIRAQVRERQEARQLAREKKAAGFRTALVESERENLFTLSLGNVQPGDFVVIQLKYFQTLRSLAGMPSVEIPFCPGVRYIPGKPLLRSNLGKGVVDDTDEVPDASRITPIRIDAGHPDAAYLEVRGTLDGKFVNEQDIQSPSHPIAVQRTGDEWRITLSDKGDVPDRDFVLRWSERNAEAVASRVWIREQGGATYALLEIRAPKDAPTERAPVDFYFLVDRSGSMAGEKWNKAVEALQSCVQVIGPADRAMVTFFETRFQDFAERPLSARELLGDEQFQQLKKLGTGGGTELRPALKHVLEIAGPDAGSRRRNLILITDAQIGNEPAILQLMKSAPDLAVHCFGIDVALNDSLLLALCRQQGGTFYSLNPNDDIERAVTSLGKTLGQPILLDLRLSEGWESAEAAIPNLYAGQIHYLSARSLQGKPGLLELAARDASSQPVSIQFERQPATAEAPYLHWCKSRIQRLMAEANPSAAIALSVESNLICPLTAFIAWDESEKVPIATHELVQPALEVGSCHFVGGGVLSEAAPGGLMKRSRVSGLTEKLALSAGLRKDVGDSECENPLQQTAGLNELGLKRALSNLCHRMGVPDWEKIVKVILDWIAAGKRGERLRRIELANELLRELKPHAGTFANSQTPEEQRRIEEAREQVQAILKSFLTLHGVRI